MVAQDDDSTGDDTTTVEQSDDGDDADSGDDAEEGDDGEEGDGGDDGDDGDDADEAEEDDGQGGNDKGVKITPPKPRVLVGRTRQFRVAGPSQGLVWMISDGSAEGIAAIDEDGLLMASEGGWVVIGVEDVVTLETIATTDTIWIMGGPTKIGKRGGRAFAASDTFVTVQFPPNASERAMTVHIEKRGKNDLPEKAKGKGTAVAVFEFNVTDSDTGEDIGGEGFDETVSLTLHYDEDLIPEGVSEEDLVAATFDEESELWEVIPEELEIDVDTPKNRGPSTPITSRNRARFRLLPEHGRRRGLWVSWARDLNSSPRRGLGGMQAW